MVRLKCSLILMVLLLVNGLPSIALNSWVEKDGFHIDGRGQIENSPIVVPHPENTPQGARVVQETTSFDNYYKVNIEGYRSPEGKVPLITGYSALEGSYRPVRLYDKEEYINVWCSGQKHVGKVDCLTEDYAISFFPVSQWSRAITTAAWRAKWHKQKGAAFLYIDVLDGSLNDMSEAKKWAELWGATIFFGTIDAGIPVDWVN